MKQTTQSPFGGQTSAQPYAPFYPTNQPVKEFSMQSKVYTPTVKVPVNFHARPSESSQVQFAHSLSGSSFQPTLQAPEMNCNDNMVS